MPADEKKKPTVKKLEPQPNGTKIPYVLKDGTKTEAVWLGEKGEEKLCCIGCHRKFSQGPSKHQVIENAKKRKEDLLNRGREEFNRIKEMMRKNAERLGEEPLSDEEFAAMLAGAEEDEAAAG